MRPVFPQKALVTAGMPYANKGLHFGHIGGVFVPADCYARFLRDRIGSANVLFVSGTDCYGSPIDEGYRKLAESGAFSGSVLHYVEQNHQQQAAALAAYDISLDIFEGSALGKCKEVHEQMTREIFEQLYQNGWLSLDTTAQFFDEDAQTFLNGRQVTGHCPVQGCKSQHAYADECDLGHQYRPVDLLNPISSISGRPPLLREVQNWYFDLPQQTELLRAYVAELRAGGTTRAVVADTIAEFLSNPVIYVKQEHLATYEALMAELPVHTYRPVEKGKASFELEFTNLGARDKARQTLEAAGLRMRTGKALVPFRLTGNIAWGVPAPVIEGAEDLTVWCWPESLWAPISFTRCWLASGGEGVETLNPASNGRVQGSWQDFWCSKDATVYQFIGQDNIYFYGVAQTGLWAALAATPSKAVQAHAPEGALQQSQLIANYHLLFMDKKASSSSDLKPPMATELLDHYTAEQLRAHFLALGLGKKPVSFKPQALAVAKTGQDAAELKVSEAAPAAKAAVQAGAKTPDPVLKESALLTNVFNRLARSCFYEAQGSCGGLLPLEPVPVELIQDATDTILAYEQAMYTADLHTAFDLASEFIRRANKYWSEAIKQAGDDSAARRRVVSAAFYLLRTATVLMHPMVPRGTELIFSHLGFACSPEHYFSWEHIFEGNDFYCTPEERAAGGHAVQALPPRFDFFERHASQL